MTSSYAPLQPATSEGEMVWTTPAVGDEPSQSVKTWYRITGELKGSSIPPLIVAHGGPGCTHNYTLSIADLAAPGSGSRAVIHYDQLGNGKSTHLRHLLGRGDFWTVDLFLQELHTLVKTLGLTTYHFLGQSWGGFLAQEFALSKPDGLLSVVLADTASSFPEFTLACNKWREDLPAEVEATLKKHEASKTFTDPEYLAACEVFYARHVCRVVPYPAEVALSFSHIDSDPTVYHTMNGPSEFTTIGSIKDWSVIDRLPEIRIPVLIVSGRYDEAAPSVQESTRKGLVNTTVTAVLFQESAHLPHVEERDKYMEVVGTFLAKVDSSL